MHMLGRYPSHMAVPPDVTRPSVRWTIVRFRSSCLPLHPVGGKDPLTHSSFVQRLIPWHFETAWAASIWKYSCNGQPTYCQVHVEMGEETFWNRMCRMSWASAGTPLKEPRFEDTFAIHLGQVCHGRIPWNVSTQPTRRNAYYWSCNKTKALEELSFLGHLANERKHPL